MSDAAKWSLNFTEDGFRPAHPHDFPSTEHGNGRSRMSTIALIVIVHILVFAAILCLKFPSLYYMVFRCKGQDQDQDQEQDTAAPPPVAAMGNTQRKAMRYAEAEACLISRWIEPHDEICEKALLHLDSSTDNPKDMKDGTSSVDTACTDVECGSFSADEETECPVCMDVLEVGDLVSWSPNANCEHVFHHCCIKEWLLKRECCPCCREIFLPANQLEDLTQSKRTEELLLGQQQLPPKRFFCIRHGVVTLSEPELCFTKKCELEQPLNKVHRVPSRTELAVIRGCRVAQIGSSCGVDGFIPVTVALSEEAAISEIDEEPAGPHTSTESTDDSPIARAA
jgi:hypothetical protein